MISVVMPVLDGRRYLEQTLPPLLRLRGSAVAEVIVVDDGSTDGSADVAGALGARVLHTAGRTGAGAARNVGAQAATQPVVLFVDADVLVGESAIARLEREMAFESVAAVIGSYDDRPPCRDFISLYMNLRHHFYHQQGAEDASVFWSGFGAVRKAAFEGVGGFPESYMEDIELGYRLRGAGHRIRLVPELRVTHLKHWTLRRAVRTDVVARALPWSRLLLTHPEARSDLNVALRERVAAVVAWLLPATVALSAAGVAPWWTPALPLGCAAWLNRTLLKLFARAGGPGFAIAALLYHQVYYLYSSATYALCTAVHFWRRIRA